MQLAQSHLRHLVNGYESNLSVLMIGQSAGSRRNVLDYLSSCFEAQLRGQKVPSLVPAN